MQLPGNTRPDGPVLVMVPDLVRTSAPRCCGSHNFLANYRCRLTKAIVQCCLWRNAAHQAGRQSAWQGEAISERVGTGTV